MKYDDGYLDNNYKSILEGLEDRNIINICKDNGGFRISEACDHYYTAVLTKEQLIKLSDELREFAESL